MKRIFHFIILLGLFSSCNIYSYIYRKPAIGLVYDRYTQKKGMVFRYKPMVLIIIAVLFLISCYGIIVGKPFNEILSFIG
ncbi:hypothetical protein [Pedobacter sp. V48]|uniref:hypothetical protein n=1 Tax=Pedobacter sp. V48 TaxID=509635 RepID=UPI0003E4F498|nr:hypothetical protein [Pedobacter sp. V48]ETZ22787.1 hypothetical protein N824_21080 [Pedobacter sp. V48]